MPVGPVAFDWVLWSIEDIDESAVDVVRVSVSVRLTNTETSDGDRVECKVALPRLDRCRTLDEIEEEAVRKAKEMLRCLVT